MCSTVCGKAHTIAEESNAMCVSKVGKKPWGLWVAMAWQNDWFKPLLLTTSKIWSHWKNGPRIVNTWHYDSTCPRIRIQEKLKGFDERF